MVNHYTTNDMASLAESTSTHSDVPSSLQPIADNVAKCVKFIFPQANAAPEVIDVDIDENDAPPAPEQDDETDKRTQENLVLHPGLKLECFRLHKDEWIEASTPAAHVSAEDKERQCADDFGDISLGTATSSLTTTCGNQWRIPKSHCNGGFIIKRRTKFAPDGTRLP